MAWEELTERLNVLGAKVEHQDPLWRVEGTNKESLRAHPAFLDTLRIAGKLEGLLTATGRDLGILVGQLRVTLDRHLEDMAGVRAALGLVTPGLFTGFGEQVALLAHHRAISGQGSVLSDGAVLTDAAAFANRHQAATVQDFIQLHAVYIAAVQSFKAAYDRINHPGRVDRLYALAQTAVAGTQAGPVRLGAAQDWQNPRPAFIEAAKVNAERLNFSTPNALIGHALKHIILGVPQLPNDQGGMTDLVAAYLAEARRKITGTDVEKVTSALGQVGNARTYYYGTVHVEVAMVAVNESGDAWISTYYAPTRT